MARECYSDCIAPGKRPPATPVIARLTGQSSDPCAVDMELCPSESPVVTGSPGQAGAMTSALCLARGEPLLGAPHIRRAHAEQRRCKAEDHQRRKRQRPVDTNQAAHETDGDAVKARKPRLAML